MIFLFQPDIYRHTAHRVWRARSPYYRFGRCSDGAVR